MPETSAASATSDNLGSDRPTGSRFVRFFREIGIADVPLVGGKNASLGEMYRELTAKGILVPNGFAVTAEAYRHALDAAGAWPALKESLDGLDPEDVDDLARRAKRARDIVYSAGLPAEVETDIRIGDEAARRGIRPRAFRRRALLGDGGGSARRELRRPARHLSQHPRRGCGARRRAPLFREPLHRSGDPLSDRQ